MNNDIFAGQWRQMRGTLRSWWGKLTDDDFDWIGGQTDKLVGVIQEKYGYTSEQAENEVERRFNEYGGATGGWSPSGVAENISSTAHELSSTAASKAREARAGVASGLETAGSYFKEHKLEEIAVDLTGLIRKYPVQSVLVAAGLVYLLSRSSNK